MQMKLQELLPQRVRPSLEIGPAKGYFTGLPHAIVKVFFSRNIHQSHARIALSHLPGDHCCAACGEDLPSTICLPVSVTGLPVDSEYPQPYGLAFGPEGTHAARPLLLILRKLVACQS